MERIHQLQDNVDELVAQNADTLKSLNTAVQVATRNEKYIKVLTLALSLMSKNIPYVFGGYSEKGYDCSGYMKRIFAEIGVVMPHLSSRQATFGTPVAVDELQLGDIVGIDLNDRNGAGVEHVGMYVGNGLIIQTRNNVERIKMIDFKAEYPTKQFVCCRVF
jgi:cell wall-associated NlpC family hydrolase